MSLQIKVGFVWPGYAAWVPNKNTIIIAKPEYATNERLITHELAHVKQHRQYGIWFYPAYILGFIRAGFNYKNNWMEKEARKAENNPQMRRWARKVIRENPL